MTRIELIGLFERTATEIAERKKAKGDLAADIIRDGFTIKHEALAIHQRGGNFFFKTREPEAADEL